ncbi:unnamed protein product [Symbiodinium microadriaticum]|nr:unnamed protein product [Symbiodinium microadriaticum]
MKKAPGMRLSRSKDFKKAATALNVAASATSGLSGSSRQLPVKRIQNALLEKSLGLLVVRCFALIYFYDIYVPWSGLDILLRDYHLSGAGVGKWTDEEVDATLTPAEVAFARRYVNGFTYGPTVAGSLEKSNRVTQLRVENIKVTAGNNAGKFLFNVRYANERPGLHTKLFAKVPISVPFQMTKETKQDRLSSSVLKQPMDFFEINTYRLAETTLPIPTPKFYYGDISNLTSNFILITERVPFVEMDGRFYVSCWHVTIDALGLQRWQKVLLVDGLLYSVDHGAFMLIRKDEWLPVIYDGLQQKATMEAAVTFCAWLQEQLSFCKRPQPV